MRWGGSVGAETRSISAIERCATTQSALAYEACGLGDSLGAAAASERLNCSFC